MKWIFLMAWREGRAIFKQLFLFLLSISVGIAALVASNSLQQTVQSALDENAKSLLGADLVIQSRQEIPQQVFDQLKKSDVVFAQETLFNSMAFFPKSDNSRLVVVRAIEGEFPFYGKMETVPEEAQDNFREKDEALLEEALFYQFDLNVGDSLFIGKKEFKINGQLIKNPGEVMGSFFAAPRVFISKRYVEATNLIKVGSLRRHKIYVKEESELRLGELIKELKELSDQYSFRLESVLDRREQVGTGAENLNRFLNLASFIVLLMGGVGVASSIHIYIQKKKTTMAVLKCLGATGRQGLSIFTIQAVFLGLVGAFMGALIGIFMQKGLTAYLAGYLPFPLPFEISWSSIIYGFLIGSIMSFLFSLIPLIPIQHVSPLNAIRSTEGDDLEKKITLSQKIILGVLFLAIFLFAFFYIKNLVFSLVFVLSLFLVLGIFWGTANLLMKVVKNKLSNKWPYSFRQGLANLYQPNNQTTLLLTSIGFGVFLIMMMTLTHQSLLKKFQASTEEGRPNMGLFDIGKDMLPGVKKLISDQGMPVLQSVPIVGMRLSSVNGRSVQELKKDDSIPKWTLRRQYRSTYRDVLNNNEKLVKGKWHTELDASKPPYPVSFEQEIADDLNVGVGDKVVFDVSGRPVETIISSIRKVDWYQIQPTFFVVFPSAVLEKAPQFHVLSTHAKSSEDSARLQRAAAKTFPEVSIVDLRIILAVVDRFVSQISSAIRFVAILIVVAGFTMLVGTLATSRFQRQKQTVLLRTFGASRRQIASINFVEYIFLGLLAILTGLVPSVLASWVMTEYFFKSAFYLNVGSVFTIGGSVLITTVFLCYLNFRPILNQSPIDVLRAE